METTPHSGRRATAPAAAYTRSIIRQVAAPIGYGWGRARSYAARFLHPSEAALAARAPGAPARLVAQIGVLSGVLYVVLIFAMRAMYGWDSKPGHSLQAFRLGAGVYYATILCLFALYVRLLLVCRNGRLSTSASRRMALVFPVLFYLMLMITQPYLSFDLLSYIGHGYLTTVPGKNPYVDAVSAVANLPLGPRLEAFGWEPVHGVSPYGPLWTAVESTVLHLTQNVLVAMLLIKGVVTVASLSTAVLIWKVLARTHPSLQLLGTLTYLWCPMLVVEFGANGHNDALMIVFVLLAILFAIRTRPASSLVAMALGTLVKYVPLIFVPAQLAYVVRTQSNGRDLPRKIGLGLALGLALSVVLYLPFWVGPSTFVGVLGSNQSAASGPRILIDYVASHILAHVSWVDAIARVVLDTLFAACVLIISWRVRDPASLCGACGRIALIYFLFAFPGYWPWYAALPVALLALSPMGRLLWLTLLLSLCSDLVAPLDVLRADGVISLRLEFLASNAIGLALPCMALLGFYVIGRWPKLTHSLLQATALRFTVSGEH